jgi:hypothetical protein
MQIRSRMSMSADGDVTTPSGWPALTADPAFVSGESHGIREFLEDCEAALIHVVVDSDPAHCWRRSAPPIRAATSISSAARARSRPSARSERSTSSSWSCCRCSSEAGCS